MNRLFLIGSLSVALTACAGTVETHRIEHQDANRPLMGVSYALPQLQYSVTASHTLTRCGTESGTDYEVLGNSFDFETDIKRTARYIPGERYNVDYSKLSGLFRTSSFAIEYYPEGTIKSIGVSADDKTGDAIESTAKLAAGVIALTTGTPALALPIAIPKGGGKIPLVDGNTPPPKKSASAWVCSDKAQALLTALNTKKAALKTAQAKLMQANNDVERLTKRFALKVIVDGDDKLWDTAIAGQIVQLAAVKKAKAGLEKAKAPLTMAVPFTFPNTTSPKSGEQLFTSHWNKYPTLQLKWGKLFKVDTIRYKDLSDDADLFETCSGKLDAVNSPPAPLIDCLSGHLDLALHFVRDWPKSVTKPSSEPTSGKVGWSKDLARIEPNENGPYEGFFYREPAQGGLAICYSRKANVAFECENTPLAKPKMVNFPQAGQLRFIPFKVLAFQGKEQTLIFTKDGYPSKIEHKSTKAAGTAALSAAANASQTVADAIEKREEERRSDAKANREAMVADLTTQIDLLQKQAELNGLNADPATPSAEGLRLAEINADIQIKRAELQQLLLSEGIRSGTIDPLILFGPN